MFIEEKNPKYNLQELVFQHGNNQYQGECEFKVDINGSIYIKIHENELPALQLHLEVIE